MVIKLDHPIHKINWKCECPDYRYRAVVCKHIHAVRLSQLLRVKAESKKFVFPGRQTFPFMAVLQRLDFVKDMDVVQANTLVAGYSGWRIARKYNKPSLLFCHEFWGDIWKIVGQNFLEKMIKHPLTDNGLNMFLDDWEKVKKANPKLAI